MTKTKINYQLESFLSKEDLLKLKGGKAGTGQWMACSCTGTPNPPFSGDWEKCYDDVSVMYADIDRMCASGGSCENQNLWCNVTPD